MALTQRQYGVDVNVTSSSFHNNLARFGSGLLISLFAGVHDTHVTVDGCWFNASTIAIVSDIHLPAHIEYDVNSPG